VAPVDSQVDSRLGRVEELIEILAHNAGINKVQDGSTDKSSTHTTSTAQEDEERLRRNTVPSAKVNPVRFFSQPLVDQTLIF
jgi:hypothetical protein